MTEGIVRIYMSIKEPEDKNLLWLRPFLKKEGYELLYYGSTGWTKWYCGHHKDMSESDENDIPDDDIPCGCPD